MHLWVLYGGIIYQCRQLKHIWGLRGLAPWQPQALFYVVSSAAEGGGRNKKNLKLTALGYLPLLFRLHDFRIA